MKLVALIFLLICYYCILCPYTKVEESFNLQATHDVMHHFTNIDRYDHLEFPGVVPRTFLGPTILGLLTYAVTHVLRWFIPEGKVINTTIAEQIVARLILGAIVTISLNRFTKAVNLLFGYRAAIAFVLLLCCQFHILFWSSRTLPNTFALPLALVGLANWIESLAETVNHVTKLRRMITYMTIGGIVFRFEVGILLAILVVAEWINHRLSIRTIVTQGVAVAAFSLALTVPLDSMFWRRWLWPEGVVFYFNAILNKSSEWGTLPFHAYFANFLPRLLLLSYPLSVIAFLTEVRVRRMLAPALVYVLAFSLLPHKEWRFIIYTIPLFTAAAASVTAKVSIRMKRSVIYSILLLGIIGGMILSFAGSNLMFAISRRNYPGGHALYGLHTLEDQGKQVSVHIDVLTAMTGASRFGQMNPHWTYNKNESYTTSDDFIEAGYTHLITATPEMHSEFQLIDTTYGFDHLKLKPLQTYLEEFAPVWDRLWPVEIIVKPKLYTLRLQHPQQTWIECMLRKYPVILFSKTYCSYCKLAKSILNRYCDKQYHVVEVDQRSDAWEMKKALYQLSGRQTFPNLFVNGKSVGGADELKAHDQNGALRDMLPCK
ncbi:dolichyl-P-Man:Man(7)GlcNAc(2)-PP-dolichol alpha-1,6-mannosyltransferase [Apophysomyces ossiformis]|uniref:Mannosyltransferase n=1 Tax=Apophysomyces ossiformis TaxID=679940 RepID=A0A8H7BUF0_9FUNG|nr:dolichyl-P-Man:Man(7)GlcNAc(2)-PP-dolichol alpha-1,6-mannosyltransferase [Apophysomyces ossiformis]